MCSVTFSECKFVPHRAGIVRLIRRGILHTVRHKYAGSNRCQSFGGGSELAGPGPISRSRGGRVNFRRRASWPDCSSPQQPPPALQRSLRTSFVCHHPIVAAYRGGLRQIHWVLRDEGGTLTRGRAGFVDRELPKIRDVPHDFNLKIDVGSYRRSHRCRF
jgi:hypothetical protein